MRFQTSEGCRRRGLTQPLSLDRAYDVEELRARVLHVIFSLNLFALLFFRRTFFLHHFFSFTASFPSNRFTSHGDSMTVESPSEPRPGNHQIRLDML